MRALAPILFALGLSACSPLTGAASSHPEALRAAEVALCSADTPLVSEMLTDGKPALDKLLVNLKGALRAIKENEQLTTAQHEALIEVGATIEELRDCLE